jgi:hypothetical protein
VLSAWREKLINHPGINLGEKMAKGKKEGKTAVKNPEVGVDDWKDKINSIHDEFRDEVSAKQNRMWDAIRYTRPDNADVYDIFALLINNMTDALWFRDDVVDSISGVRAYAFAVKKFARITQKEKLFKIAEEIINLCNETYPKVREAMPIEVADRYVW